MDELLMFAGIALSAVGIIVVLLIGRFQEGRHWVQARYITRRSRQAQTKAGRLGEKTRQNIRRLN